MCYDRNNWMRWALGLYLECRPEFWEVEGRVLGHDIQEGNDVDAGAPGERATVSYGCGAKD